MKDLCVNNGYVHINCTGRKDLCEEIVLKISQDTVEVTAIEIPVKNNSSRVERTGMDEDIQLL